MFVDAAPAKTTSAPKFEAPSTSKISRFAVPSTSISALRSIPVSYTHLTLPTKRIV